MKFDFEQMVSTVNAGVFCSILVGVKNKEMYLSVISREQGFDGHAGGIIDLNTLDDLVKTLIRAREELTKS